VLSRREYRTLAAATRALVPGDGSIPQSADDLGLVEKLTIEVNGYPKRAHRRMKQLFFGTEYLPLLSGRLPFSRQSPERQLATLEVWGHHKRSPLRRLIVSFLKQLVYGAYISEASVEDAVAYRYECAIPREGVEGPRVHH
jgi:hypothetical protein